MMARFHKHLALELWNLVTWKKKACRFQISKSICCQSNPWLWTFKEDCAGYNVQWCWKINGKKANALKIEYEIVYSGSADEVRSMNLLQDIKYGDKVVIVYLVSISWIYCRPLNWCCMKCVVLWQTEFNYCHSSVMSISYSGLSNASNTDVTQGRWKHLLDECH